LKDLIVHFLVEKVLKAESCELITEKLTFEEGTKLKSFLVLGSIPIYGIELRGFKRVSTRLDPDYFANRIWLLMKLIFENKNMVVTVNGEIEEPPSGEAIELHVGQKCIVSMKITSRQFLIKGNLGNMLLE
jgi:hypothetical protein